MPDTFSGGEGVAHVLIDCPPQQVAEVLAAQPGVTRSGDGSFQLDSGSSALTLFDGQVECGRKVVVVFTLTAHTPPIRRWRVDSQTYVRIDVAVNNAVTGVPASIVMHFVAKNLAHKLADALRISAERHHRHAVALN